MGNQDLAEGQQQSYGLFDGFEGYRTPTEEDYRFVLSNGLIVPDTNVLLNLYRYNPQAQTDLLAVLRALGDRLWVPSQVIAEFWRNRESAIRDPQDSAAKTVAELTNRCDESVNALRAWVHRAAVSSEQLSTLQAALESGYKDSIDFINGLVDQDADVAWNTQTDPVLKELESVLAGRVGGPLEGEARTQAVKEGLRRIGADIPPGYKDKNKDDEKAVGDFLMWEQLLCEAGNRKHDVLLVTADVKEDWWRRDRGQTRGPRLELIDEMRRRAGVRLLMTQPERLLVLARDVLNVEVQEQSVQDVGRVDKVQADDEVRDWNEYAVQELLDRLDIEAPAQADAIRLAAENDGFVSREDVYGLGGYEANRTLRGFTRPPSRIAQAVCKTLDITPSVVDPLEAVYESADSPFVASGFRVPALLVPLILGANDDFRRARDARARRGDTKDVSDPVERLRRLLDARNAARSTEATDTR